MLNYRTFGQVWKDTCEYLANPPRGIQLPWWPALTDLIGGLRPHEVTLLCAPTGAGKSQLLANISAQLFLQDIPHFVAPVETGDIDHGARVLSVLADRDFNDGDPQDPKALQDLTNRFGARINKNTMFISSYDNRVEGQEMIDLLKYQYQKHGIKVALLDNLNFFLKVVSTNLEKLEMDNAIHDFVMLAKKLPIHVILIVHPKKTDGGRVISEFDIKGSSTAVQEAPNVLLFNRPELEDIRTKRREFTDRELVFKKIRKRGINVNKPIWMSYKNARFLEQI